MPIRYLLDTNTASYIIKGNPPNVRRRLLAVPISHIGISVITEAELRFGALRRPESTRIKLAVDEFLHIAESLPWTSEAAKKYASLRAKLESSGEIMGNLDMMIAAHAIAVEAVLVTSDQAFRRIKHLKIQDWTKG